MHGCNQISYVPVVENREFSLIRLLQFELLYEFLIQLLAQLQIKAVLQERQVAQSASC